MRRAAGALCLLLGVLGATAASAQPTEIMPTEVPSVNPPTEYRSDFGLTARGAAEKRAWREQARKTYWAEEAKRIARSGQDVVRDDENLYVHLVPGGRSAFVFRTTSIFSEGTFYLYQAFDEVGQFHVVSAGALDNEGDTLLISAKTGLIYRLYGAPVWSPDKTRFFANAFNGMGCIEGVAVYRYDSDKLFKEAESAMGCDQPCQHRWSGPDEIRSDCRNASGVGRVDYRLTRRDGAWHITRSPEAR